jgi:hypothetical protein
MPRRLQNKIHSEKSTSNSVWSDYRSQILVLWAAVTNHADFNDHLIREFNNKVDRLKLSISKIAPNKSGRYTGSNTSNLT